MDFWIVSLIISIILLFSGFLTFLGLLFVGGTRGISTVASFADEIPSEISFLIQTGIWEFEHHINNFCTTILTGAIPLFHLLYFKMFYEPFKFKKFKIRYTYIIYISVIGIVGIYAVMGEIIEQTGRKVIRVCIGNNTAALETFEGFSSETLDDVVLSDLAFQYLLTAIEGLIFLLFIFKGRGPLFFFKKGYILFFRVILKLLFPVIGFFGTLRKDFVGDGVLWPIGFYGIICLKLCILCILFLEDYYHVTRSKTVKQFVNPKDVINVYVFLLLYVSTQYISTFNLTTWGIPVSHVVATSYLLILFFIKLKTVGHIKSLYEPLVPYPEGLIKI